MWFESEPLWTRHSSGPVEKGCAPSVVTADFGRHAGVADAVRAAHLRELEAARDVGRVADLLVDLDGVARAHDAQPRIELADRGARPFQLLQRHAEHGVRVLHRDRHIRADRSAEPVGEAVEILLGAGRLDGELAEAVIGAAVDGDAGAVRPAIAELGEHVGEHRAELRLERFVLEEKTDDAAHGIAPSGRRRPAAHGQRPRHRGITGLTPPLNQQE